MEVYGVLVSGGNVLLTDGTSGKRLQFNDKPIEPDGFVAVYSFVEFADFIGQMWTLKPKQESIAEAAVRLASVQAQNLDDSQILDFISLLPEFDPNGVQYEKDFKLQYNGEAYKVLQAHKSQADWTPDTAHSLFVKIDPVTEADPEAITEWVEKQNGIDEGYKKDQVVTKDGKYWKSKIDNNFYEPSAETYAAWEDVTSQYSS